MYFAKLTKFCGHEKIVVFLAYANTRYYMISFIQCSDVPDLFLHDELSDWRTFVAFEDIHWIQNVFQFDLYVAIST